MQEATAVLCRLYPGNDLKRKKETFPPLPWSTSNLVELLFQRCSSSCSLPVSVALEAPAAVKGSRLAVLKYSPALCGGDSVCQPPVSGCDRPPWSARQSSPLLRCRGDKEGAPPCPCVSDDNNSSR